MITTHDRFKSTIGFIDILFNILIGFAFLFIVAFLMIKPESKKEDFDRKAEFIIVMEWDDTRKDDIDLYVQDPTGKIVNFAEKKKLFLKDVTLRDYKSFDQNKLTLMKFTNENGTLHFIYLLPFILLILLGYLLVTKKY